MNRRNVLKAAGASTALALVSGAATAGGDDSGDDGGDDDSGRGGEQRECPIPNCIHPTLGYPGLSPDENLPAPLQPTHEVDLLIRPREDRPIPEFFFEPTGLRIDPGDVVRFNLATPDHTVTAYHPGFGRQRRVPEGVPPFSSPVLAGGTFWLYRFDEGGVYDLLCAPHEVFGMVTRIVVGDAEAGFGEPSGQLRPPELTAGLVYEDPALDPANISETGRVGWDDLAEESKEVLIEFPDAGDGG